MAPPSKMPDGRGFASPSCATAASLLDAIPLSELCHSIDHVTGGREAVFIHTFSL